FAFSKATKMKRTPPTQPATPQGSAPGLPSVKGQVDVETDTPKRAREESSPCESNTAEGAKRSKGNLRNIDEIGRILDDLLYHVNEKKPVQRTINASI
ncbi:hypothetical protein KR084_005527, partial [Drosophila pseudotakahashii]